MFCVPFIFWHIRFSFIHFHRPFDQWMLLTNNKLCIKFAVINGPITTRQRWWRQYIMIFMCTFSNLLQCHCFEARLSRLVSMNWAEVKRRPHPSSRSAILFIIMVSLHINIDNTCVAYIRDVFHAKLHRTCAIIHFIVVAIMKILRSLKALDLLARSSIFFLSLLLAM